MDSLKLNRLADADSSVVVRHLSNQETEALRARLAPKIDLHSADPSVTLVKSLRARSRALQGPRADEIAFDLRAIFYTSKLLPNERVYINWHRFDDVDEVELKQLCRLFDEFWYPAADDINIFDDTLNWVVSIDHEGTVYLARGDSRLTV